MTPSERSDREWARAEVRAIRSKIEDFAPEQVLDSAFSSEVDGAKRRDEVHQFLTVPLPRRAEWNPSASWRSLRTKMHRQSQDRLPLHWLVREFYAVLRNAIEHNAVDALEGERRRRARAALPKRRWMERSGPKLRALALAADQIDDPALRQRALNLEIGRYAFLDPAAKKSTRSDRAPALAAILTLGDFLPRPGVARRTGRPAALETAQDDLLCFFRGFGLSKRAAASVTRDCLAWFVGVHVGERTLLSRKARLRAKR